MFHLHALPATCADSQGIQTGLTIAGFTDFGNSEVVGPIAQVGGTPIDSRVVGCCCFQSYLPLIQEEHETGILGRYSSLRLESRKGSINVGAFKTNVYAACWPGKDQRRRSKTALFADIAAESTLQQHVLGRDASTEESEHKTRKTEIYARHRAGRTRTPEGVGRNTGRS